MKLIITITCLSVWLLAGIPITAHATECAEYLRLLGNYYRLDQEFKSITCNIVSPALNNSLGHARTLLSPLQSKVDIKENLVDYSLTFTKSSGLKINNPSVEVMIISEEGMTDPEKVRRGIEMMNQGFREQIDGIDMQLEGIFEGFSHLKQSDCKIDEITHNDGVYTARYEKGNSVVTEIYAKNQRQIREVSKSGDETFSVENYDKLFNNKLVLTSAHITISQSMINTEVDVSISYEDIKGVLFPAHIVNHIKQVMQTFQQEGQTEIYLKNCSLE